MLKKLRKLKKIKKVARKPLRSTTKRNFASQLQCTVDHCNEEELHGIPYDLVGDIQSITQLLDDFGCYRYFSSFGGGSMMDKDIKLMEKRFALFFNWSFLKLKGKIRIKRINAKTFDRIISVIMKEHLDIVGQYVDFVKSDKTMMYSTIKIWIFDIKKVIEWYSVFANRVTELRELFITFQTAISNIGNYIYIIDIACIIFNNNDINLIHS